MVVLPQAPGSSPVAFAKQKMSSTVTQVSSCASSQPLYYFSTDPLQPRSHCSTACPRYLEEYQTKRFRLKPAFASEQQIVALEALPGSPEPLVEEFTRIREGLLELRHNVVLLRCNEDPDAFYPVSFLRKGEVASPGMRPALQPVQSHPALHAGPWAVSVAAQQHCTSASSPGFRDHGGDHGDPDALCPKSFLG